MPAEATLAAEFRAVLRPLLNRLIRKRTISLGKSGILNQLTLRGPSTASELAITQGITPQGVAVALRELEDHAFVARVRDSEDRRKMRVEITEAGTAVLNSDRAAGTAWLAESIAAHLDAADRKILEAAIPVMHKLMEEVATQEAPRE